MAADPLIRLRALCLALPGATEKVAWGESTFRAPKMFATYAGADNHHGAGRPAAWIKATAVNQALLIESDPDRFFKPPYVGPSGWIGVWLDRRPPWKQVAELLEDGYRLVAPRALLVQLDARRS
ncbi:MAG TPA: MmcQ/YjbR family DNA-binding protein [Gemmatimonadaceae bacterium]|nr:MmcQ/YjbR family DNA-binding protein [Gemmatimonadaceae bacterium]